MLSPPIPIPLRRAGLASGGIGIPRIGQEPRGPGADASYVYLRMAASSTGLDTTLVTPLPPDARAGWTAILAVDTAPGVAVNTGPSGSSTLQDGDLGNCKVSIYLLTLTSTDISNGTLTVTRTASTSWSSAAICSPLAYDQLSASSSSTTVQTGPLTIPAVTPGADNAVRVGIVFGRTDTVAVAAEFTHPDGWAVEGQRSDNHPTARRRPLAVYSQQLVGQNTVAQPTATVFATQNVNYASFSITLKPVAVDTRPAPDTTKLAIDGDSLVRQNGLGGSSDPGTDLGTGDVPASMSSLKGWTLGNVIAHGVTGRLIIGGGSTPTIETTIAAQRAAGFEPFRRIFALGANNQSATVAQNMIDIRAYLVTVGPGREVVFFGLGYYDQTDCAVTFTGGNPVGSKWSASGANGSVNAAMLNIIDEGTNPLTEASVVGYYNWNDSPIVRSLPSGVAPTDIWKMDDVSSGTGQPRHMVQIGYQNYRNVALAEAAGNPPGVATPADNSGLSDAVALSLSLDRSELLGLSDSVALVFGPSLSDAEGLSDALAQSVSLGISDAEGLSDSIAENISLGINDAEGLADSQALVQSKGLDDLNGLSDSSSAALSRSVSVSDSEGLSDIVGSGLSLNPSVSDSEGLSDSIGLGANSSVSDTEGLSDAVSTVKSIVVNDPSNLTDSPALLQDKGLADPEGLSDSSGVAQSLGRVLSDDESLQDSLSLQQTKVVSDSEGLSDAASPSLTSGTNFTRTPADTEGLSDTPIRLARGITGSDDLGLSDTASPVLSSGTNYSRTPADTEGLSDTPTRMALAASRQDVLSLGDSVSAVKVGVGFTRSVSDSESLSDGSSHLARGAARTDETGLSDTVSVSLAASFLSRSPVDTENLSDSPTRVARLGSRTDVLGLSDSPTRMAKSARRVDALGLSDSVVVSLSSAGVIARSFTNQLSVLDSDNPEQVWISWEERRTDNLGLSDSVSTSLTSTGNLISRSQADSENLSDSASAQLITVIARSVSDGLGLSDAVTVQVFQLIARSVSDTLGLSDSTTQQAIPNTGSITFVLGLLASNWVARVDGSQWALGSPGPSSFVARVSGPVWFADSMPVNWSVGTPEELLWR